MQNSVHHHKQTPGLLIQYGKDILFGTHWHSKGVLHNSSHTGCCTNATWSHALVHSCTNMILWDFPVSTMWTTASHYYATTGSNNETTSPITAQWKPLYSNVEQERVLTIKPPDSLLQKMRQEWAHKVFFIQARTWRTPKNHFNHHPQYWNKYPLSNVNTNSFLTILSKNTPTLNLKVFWSLRVLND
jgi:hypothetical protein